MALLPHRHFLDLGYALVVPIMPADGTAAPTSTLSIGNRGAGKVPGVRGDDGLWRGHREWTTRVSTLADLDLYTAMGASVGIRTGLQPDGNSLVAIDADATEALAAGLARDAIESRFGKLPCRVGRAPKALFFVRVRGPFRYRRVEYGAAKPYDRVELLSDNRQAVVEGLHPKTMQPYTWTTPLCLYGDLPLVDASDLEALMADLESVLPNVQRSKVDGDAGSAPPQESLRGELRHVRDAMRVLPNTTALFPDRESYLNVGYALKAALPDDREEGLALYLDWCARWASGDTGEVNDLDIAEADWRRMTGPFRLGAPWIFDQAERHSAGAWSKAALHFEALPPDGTEGEAAFAADDPYPLIWHGDGDDEPLASWLVDEMLFEVGTALLSGQWGTFKTFCALDLSAAVMVGGTFAGRQVRRRGGVLWLAVEGQGEVRKRLAAVAQEKIRPAIDGTTIRLDPARLPFVWVKACPKLSAPNALAEFGALIGKAAAAMKERFGFELALVIIDTLSPAAELKDADDTAENQHVMSVLKRTAQRFGTLVCAVDHMGKDTSTGTRNSSVKEADVDSVVALIGERDLAGNVAKPRVAMRKNRGAPTGWQAPFRTRVVSVTLRDEVVTTLVIDWGSAAEPRATATAPAAPIKSPWTGNARILRDALERALDAGGRLVEQAANGSEVRAVDSEKVRAEFYATYPAESQDAKRQAFNRLLKDAVGRGLVASREVEGVDFLSLRSDHPQPAADQAA